MADSLERCVNRSLDSYRDSEAAKKKKKKKKKKKTKNKKKKKQKKDKKTPSGPKGALTYEGTISKTPDASCNGTAESLAVEYTFTRGANGTYSLTTSDGYTFGETFGFFDSVTPESANNPPADWSTYTVTLRTASGGVTDTSILNKGPASLVVNVDISYDFCTDSYSGALKQ